MAQFILTAKQNIVRPNGFYLPKGHQMEITIPMAGIQPGNLFGNVSHRLTPYCEA